jgi:hypothetical protein
MGPENVAGELKWCNIPSLGQRLPWFWHGLPLSPTGRQYDQLEHGMGEQDGGKYDTGDEDGVEQSSDTVLI